MEHYYFTTKELTVGYDRKPLIRDIRIELKKGEILTLIGPNGAGKSTVLKTITKQLAPLGGTVAVDDMSLSVLSEKQLARKMSVLLTDRVKTELMTCREVVETGRYPYTGKFGILSEEDHEEVNWAMQTAEIMGLADCDFMKVSDGQRQRVMLARAICQRPGILILDEPTSYLDVHYKREFLSVLQKMSREQQMTVIMSLHELDLAERVSDRILCVDGEYISMSGTPEEVFSGGCLEKLYGMENGAFQELTGTAELKRAEGTPETFVIAGGGSGTFLYRKLQREGIPFITGILYENDADCLTAGALAAEVVRTEAFEPVQTETLEFAKEKIRQCQVVYCTRKEFKTLERMNRELLEFARAEQKKVVETDSHGQVYI